MAKLPKTISVEGNIGAGKSTFIDFIQDLEDIKVAKEPLHEWQNVNGQNLLNRMYKFPKENTFLFQVLALLTIVRDHLTHKYCATKTRVVERFMGSRCFIKNAHKNGHLTDAENMVLSDWRTFLENCPLIDMKADLIIYLRTSPEKAYQRIKKRNREEELNISYEYIQQLHDYHEEWLMDHTSVDHRVIVIDADLDLPELVSVYESTRDEIVKLAKEGGSD